MGIIEHRSARQLLGEEGGRSECWRQVTLGVPRHHRSSRLRNILGEF